MFCKTKSQFSNASLNNGKLQSSHLSMQAFICMLCDLHQCSYQFYLMHQFSIAFNVYTDILCQVEIIIEKALLHDEVNYRIKHACPCCIYELEEEMKLIYHLLFCMDGNNSLKHILWRSGSEEERRYKLLVGGFYGHAHCHLCQIMHLTTYVEGVGCEDLEDYALEGLVVARLFELMKMNMSETGMKPRNVCIWVLLTHYEDEDIRQKPWAKPAAKEEIQCLNVKICHLVTYIHDEDRYLH
ncbi:hypothetical protein ARMSODRAFT_985364 [Armillaria solidipes]|uniref:Uncharacterized protein n=1 Tax=Armillaria solidipes TaxID=1076256 RepID=A0A2H3BX36_9AGAR|nr:hypothetical protein ARMSODRAFT_985364 [Armillaria solidipes]